MAFVRTLLPQDRLASRKTRGLSIGRGGSARKTRWLLNIALTSLVMAAVATAGLSKEELAHRWNEIVKQFERVDVDGWIVETNQYGQILMSPLPEGAHQYRGSIIAELLGAYFPDHRAFYEKPVLTDLGVKNADVVLVGPDQSEQALGPKALSPAPEICVEILSPSNTQEEIDEKRAAYLRAGAKEVWICDRNNRMTFFAPSDQLGRSRLCPDFPLELDLSQRPINKLQQQLLAAYNQLVRTPEDRARLEKENPDLVAERDRIVTAQTRMLLAQQQIQSEPHTQKRSSA